MRRNLNKITHNQNLHVGVNKINFSHRRHDTVSRRQSLHGFTLIELLVVVVVIALLMAIITPALRKAKELAQLLTCKTNLKQMGIGFHVYAADNDDSPVAMGVQLTGEANQATLWVDAITYYVNKAQKVRYCPKADRNPEEEWGTAFDSMTAADIGVDLKLYVTGFNGWSWSGNAKYIWKRASVSSSYAYNGWLYAEPKNGWQDYRKDYSWGKLNTITATATVPLLSGSVWADSWPMSEDRPAPGTTWAKGAMRGPGAAPVSDFMSRYLFDRHQKRIGMVFVDGHVDNINCEDGQLWSLRWHKKWKSPSASEMDQIQRQIAKIPNE